MANSHFSGPIISTAGFQAGANGSTVSFIKKGQVTIDIASISAGAVVESTVTITGAVAGDTVILNPPAALEANVCYVGCFVSAADTVKMRVFNPTGGAIDPASASWEYCIIR